MTPSTYDSYTPSADPAPETIDVEAVWLTPDGLLPTTLEGYRQPWPSDLKRYGLIGAGILLALMGAIVALRTLKATAIPIAASRVLPVETLQVEPVSSYTVSRLYTGEIASLRSSALGFERSGEVMAVLASAGQQVSKGQPLAQLDNQTLAAQQRQLVAQKAQAQARLSELQTGARPEDIAVAAAAVTDIEQQLILQQTQAQRREYLFNQGAISQEQLDEFSYGTNSLQAKLDQARSSLAALQNGTRQEQVSAQAAAVDQIQAQIDALDITQSKSVLTAPYDGVIAQRPVDEGTVVSAGQTVVEVVESTALEAEIGVPSTVANTLKVGSNQTVQINNQPYSAQIKSVLPQVDPATRTQKVVLTLAPTAFNQIAPGQTVQMMVRDRIQTQDSYWLPIESLTEGIRGLWTCYVLVPQAQSEDTGPGDFVVEARSVEIIQQAIGQTPEQTPEQTSEQTADSNNSTTSRVLVRGTLAPEDVVVASGVHRLVPGQPVQPVSSEPNQSSELTSYMERTDLPNAKRP